MKKALIFDLDGTLLNTLGDLRDSTNFALELFGFPTRTTEEIRNFVGNGLRNLIVRALPEGAPEETVSAVLAQMKQHYAQHPFDATVPYEGIPELLNELKASGYAMAIVSNKADAMIQMLHQRFFAPYVSVAIGELEGVPRKPDPALVRLALERLGADGSHACYIGDSEVDILTAQNAGLPCLTVGWGFRDADSLLAAGAKTVLASPAELKKAIGEL